MASLAQMEVFKNKFRYTGCMGDVNNTVWLFWKANCQCTVMADSDQLLTMTVLNESWQAPILISMIYARCSPVKIRLLWDDLIQLGQQNTKPWLVMGNFYTMVCQDEKHGGRPINLASVSDFREMILQAGLSDLGYIRNK